MLNVCKVNFTKYIFLLINTKKNIVWVTVYRRGKTLTIIGVSLIARSQSSVGLRTYLPLILTSRSYTLLCSFHTASSHFGYVRPTLLQISSLLFPVIHLRWLGSLEPAPHRLNFASPRLATARLTYTSLWFTSLHYSC